VPRYPASHGCIRVPLNEGNPAKFFFEWANLGIPVEVTKD
jgi:lipoprotein-anchoring transpeptidase ErfK/SrfK